MAHKGKKKKRRMWRRLAKFDVPGALVYYPTPDPDYPLPVPWGWYSQCDDEDQLERWRYEGDPHDDTELVG